MVQTHNLLSDKDERQIMSEGKPLISNVNFYTVFAHFASCNPVTSCYNQVFSRNTNIISGLQLFSLLETGTWNVWQFPESFEIFKADHQISQ